MSNNIELGANHTHWMMTFYTYFVIADREVGDRISDEEKEERVKWCQENLIQFGKYNKRSNSSWCCSSIVDKLGLCPHWVFYFMEAEDAMAFKLRWK